MALTKVKASNITLTTASASSNDTTPATTQYVTTAINNLIDGAPATLNTLDEIAAALNDDAALNTTLTNAIAAKAPLASPTFTSNINGGDGVELRLGDSQDIIFKHHASGYGHLENKTGNLFIDSETIQIRTDIDSLDTAVYIDASHKVGIGTSSPAAMLDIKGDTSTYGGMAKIYLTDLNSNSESRNWAIGNGGSGYGHFTIGRSNSKDGDPMASGTHTTPFMIDHQDNVGIGMTPTPAVGAPLQIASSGTGYVGLRLNGSGSAGVWDLYSSYSGGKYMFGIYDRANTSYSLVTTEDGHVGIGTDTPNFLLHINKGTSSYVPAAGVNENVFGINTSYNAAGSQGVSFSRLDGNWYDGTTGADSAYGWLWSYENSVRGGLVYDHRGTERMQLFSSYGALAFITPNAADGNGVPTDANMVERLTILPGGNIGMGTASPDANSNLHIHSSGDTQLRLTTSSGANTPTAQMAYASGSGYFLRLGDGANNEDVMLRTYGDSVINGGAVTMSKQPGFFARGNTSQWLQGSSGSWNTIVAGIAHANGSTIGVNLTEGGTGALNGYDSGSDFNTSNGRFTAPIAGKYLIHGSLYCAKIGTNANDYMHFLVYVNGQQINQMYTMGGHKQAYAVDFSLNLSTVLRLDANDYVEWKIYTTSTNMRIYGDHLCIGAHMIS